MLKKLVFIGMIFVSSLFADFSTLTTQQVKDAMKNGVQVIDIRRVDEFKQYGIIKGSHKLTFFDSRGKYNIDKWMKEFTKIVKTKDQPFILLCAHANRSKVVAKFLADQAGYTNVNELKGGIMYGWIDKGNPTVK